MVNPNISVKKPGCYLDVVGVVRFFGGRTELIRDLETYGIVTLTIAAVDKWQERGVIPAARLMDLETLAHHKRKNFFIGTFIRRPARPTATKKKKVA